MSHSSCSTASVFRCWKERHVAITTEKIMLIISNCPDSLAGGNVAKLSSTNADNEEKAAHQAESLAAQGRAKDLKIWGARGPQEPPGHPTCQMPTSFEIIFSHPTSKNGMHIAMIHKHIFVTASGPLALQTGRLRGQISIWPEGTQLHHID